MENEFYGWFLAGLSGVGRFIFTVGLLQNINSHPIVLATLGMLLFVFGGDCCITNKENGTGRNSSVSVFSV